MSKAAAGRPFFVTTLFRGRRKLGITAVFLDAGYLIKVLQFDHDGARLDLSKLSQEMAAPDELLRTYYYNCMPYQSNPPTDDERRRFARMESFHTALKGLPRFELRLGRLALRGYDADGRPIFIQKRVDCMVGVDMAILAGKRTITKVALFSGDSDLIPAAEAVKREGVVVTLWHGSTRTECRPSRELYGMCDERHELSPDIVARTRLPQGRARR
jgi:uncharacterized LabA/DUF88 family protein